MIIAASAENAEKSRRPSRDGTGSSRVNFIGVDRTVNPNNWPDPSKIDPMAYLVEQDPGSHLRSHFHGVDQFQVVVGGGGERVALRRCRRVARRPWPRSHCAAPSGVSNNVRSCMMPSR